MVVVVRKAERETEGNQHILSLIKVCNQFRSVSGWMEKIKKKEKNKLQTTTEVKWE